MNELNFSRTWADRKKQGSLFWKNSWSLRSSKCGCFQSQYCYHFLLSLCCFLFCYLYSWQPTQAHEWKMFSMCNLNSVQDTFQGNIAISYRKQRNSLICQSQSNPHSCDNVHFSFRVMYKHDIKKVHKYSQGRWLVLAKAVWHLCQSGTVKEAWPICPSRRTRQCLFVSQSRWKRGVSSVLPTWRKDVFFRRYPVKEAGPVSLSALSKVGVASLSAKNNDVSVSSRKGGMSDLWILEHSQVCVLPSCLQYVSVSLTLLTVFWLWCVYVCEGIRMTAA